MVADEVQPVPRSQPVQDGTKRETLSAVLDFLRATVINKVAGLSDDDAFSAPALHPPRRAWSSI